MIKDHANRPSPEPVLNRRAEERIPASGTVEIFREGSTVPLLAKLVDRSGHGFRVRVEVGELAPGEQIRLRYRWGDVIALVVWCSRGERTEAGLFVP